MDGESEAAMSMIPKLLASQSRPLTAQQVFAALDSARSNSRWAHPPRNQLASVKPMLYLSFASGLAFLLRAGLGSLMNCKCSLQRATLAESCLLHVMCPWPTACCEDALCHLKPGVCVFVCVCARVCGCRPLNAICSVPTVGLTNSLKPKPLPSPPASQPGLQESGSPVRERDSNTTVGVASSSKPRYRMQRPHRVHRDTAPDIPTKQNVQLEVRCHHDGLTC